MTVLAIIVFAVIWFAIAPFDRLSVIAFFLTLIVLAGSAALDEKRKDKK